MPTFKTTFFFESQQLSQGMGGGSDIGWTETWYQDASDLEAALVSAATIATPGSYWFYRLPILCNIYHATWVRVSSVDNPRATKIVSLIGPFFGGIQTPSGTGAAQVTCAVLIDFTVMPTTLADKAHHRRFLLRGIPNSLIHGNVITPGSADLAALNNFCHFIGNRTPLGMRLFSGTRKWQMRYLAPTTVTTPLAALAVNDDTKKQITITASIGTPLKGSKVRISGVKFPAGVNRNWTIRSTGALGAPPYVLGDSRKQLAGTWDGTGSASVQAFGYRVPDQFVIIGLRTRHTGRPFRLTRGRRTVA